MFLSTALVTSKTEEVTPFLVDSSWREILAFEHGRQLLHLRGIGARAVQVGAAGAVDGAGILAIERQNVAGAAGGVVQIDVGQALPSAADADHLAADFAPR